MFILWLFETILYASCKCFMYISVCAILIPFFHIVYSMVSALYWSLNYREILTGIPPLTLVVGTALLGGTGWRFWITFIFGLFLLKDMICRAAPPPCLQNVPSLLFGPKQCAKFWNEWKINFPMLAIFIVSNIIVQKGEIFLSIRLPKWKICAMFWNGFMFMSFFFCVILRFWDMVDFVFNHFDAFRMHFIKIKNNFCFLLK